MNATERAGIQVANRNLAAARADLARGLTTWWVDRELERVGRMLERVLAGDFPRPEEFERPRVLTPADAVAALEPADLEPEPTCPCGSEACSWSVPAVASEAIDSIVHIGATS